MNKQRIPWGIANRVLALSLSMIWALPREVAAASSDASASSGASSTSSEDRLEDIVVVARRRVELAQTVPISITAIAADKLERNDIVTDADILRNISSVGVQTTFADSTFIGIRGQEGKGKVVTYLDEVPIPSTGVNETNGIGVGGPAMFYDMENVEVLKGPQGTLFGKNTTGGAVLFQTKMPAPEFGGSISAGYGNYNSRYVTPVLNVPLVSDVLLLRVAATLTQRDGLTQVLGTPGHPNGLDLDNRNANSVRATLTAKPNENIQNDLMFDYMRNKNNGSALILVAINPGLLGGLIGSLYPKLPAYLAEQQSLGPRTGIPISVDPGYYARFWTGTDTFRYMVSDNLTLKNIANYTEFNVYQFATNGSGTPYPIIDNNGYITADVNRQVSEELQLQGNSLQGKLAWTVGAFYLKQIPPSSYSIAENTVFGTPSYNEFRSGDESKALFAQGTYDLSSLIERLKFTVGARYTWDSFFDAVREGLPAPGVCPPALRATLPNADALCTQTGAGANSAPTWTLGLEYQLQPQSLAYIMSHRGYHEGGVNPGFEGQAFGLYQPEYVTDLEVGYKSDWHIGAMPIRTNVAAYNQWYTNIQAETLEPSGVELVYIVRNGPHAIISGVEFEGDIEPLKGLTFGLTMSYLNSNYTYAGLTPADAATLQNEILFDRPRWKSTLSGTYHLPISDKLGAVGVSADWNYQSTTGLVKEIPSLFDTQPGYGVVDLSLNWNHVGGKPIEISAYTNNALNKLYATGSYALTSVLGTSALHYGEPRMFGARIKYSWGGEAH
jgi:iron complex outermembrane recepter protein